MISNHSSPCPDTLQSPPTQTLPLAHPHFCPCPPANDYTLVVYPTLFVWICRPEYARQHRNEYEHESKFSTPNCKGEKKGWLWMSSIPPWRKSFWPLVLMLNLDLGNGKINHNQHLGKLATRKFQPFFQWSLQPTTLAGQTAGLYSIWCCPCPTIRNFLYKTDSLVVRGLKKKERKQGHVHANFTRVSLKV